MFVRHTHWPYSPFRLLLNSCCHFSLLSQLASFVNARLKNWTLSCCWEFCSSIISEGTFLILRILSSRVFLFWEQVWSQAVITQLPSILLFSDSLILMTYFLLHHGLIFCLTMTAWGPNYFYQPAVYFSKIDSIAISDKDLSVLSFADFLQPVFALLEELSTVILSSPDLFWTDHFAK